MRGLGTRPCYTNTLITQPTLFAPPPLQACFFPPIRQFWRTWQALMKEWHSEVLVMLKTCHAKVLFCLLLCTVHRSTSYLFFVDTTSTSFQRTFHTTPPNKLNYLHKWTKVLLNIWGWCCHMAASTSSFKKLHDSNNYGHYRFFLLWSWQMHWLNNTFVLTEGVSSRHSKR